MFTIATALAMAPATGAPCEPPGRLCAPNEANTSKADKHPLAVDVVKPGQPASAAAGSLAPQVPDSQVETMPVDDPASGSSSAAAPPLAPAPVAALRIGLLLPLRSEALGPPADALRAGFMAAYERDRAGITVNLIDTGDSPQEALEAYRSALGQNDLIVGPLPRSAVGAVAASGAVSKTTIALNHPEARGADATLPGKMMVMGLSIEDEARQVAQWAAGERRSAKALIISGPTAWQRRIASAIAAEWKQQGNQAQVVELAASNGYLSEAGLNQLQTRVEIEMPGLFFAALDGDQLRQVRNALGPDLPAYGTSSVNPGTEPGSVLGELDGTRLLDMPWEVQPDHPAVMVYPRWSGARRTLDLDRLYALGIDAFRVARQIGSQPMARFDMDGVTGQLSVDFGNGAARFYRAQPGAIVQGRGYKLLSTRP